MLNYRPLQQVFEKVAEEESDEIDSKTLPGISSFEYIGNF